MEPEGISTPQKPTLYHDLTLKSHLTGSFYQSPGHLSYFFLWSFHPKYFNFIHFRPIPHVTRSAHHIHLI